MSQPGTKRVLDARMRSALGWLVESGIQNVSGPPTTLGGYNAWYSPTSDTYPFVYTEITGYGLEFLSTFARRFPEMEHPLIERANLAHSWLLKMKEDGLYWYGYSLPDGPINAEKYTFDAAVCGLGLLSYYKTTSNGRILDEVELIARRLVGLQRENGSTPGMIPQPVASTRWSQVPNVHHAKIAMFLAEAGENLKDDSLVEASERLCDWVLTRRSPKGFFRTGDGPTYLHAHCYACEGLLYTGRALKNPKYEEAALDGVDWLASVQLPDGTVPQWHPNGGSVAVDCLAQSIRLWLTSGIERYEENITRGIDALLCAQQESEMRRVKGAFQYSPQNPDANPWCTMFAIKVIASYTGSIKDWRDLLV